MLDITFPILEDGNANVCQFFGKLNTSLRNMRNYVSSASSIGSASVFTGSERKRFGVCLHG